MAKHVYNAIHEIPIFNHKNEEIGIKSIAVNIFDFHDKLQIKLRDLSEYSFNYTENMDLGDFDVLRLKQNLDINFSEFKENLVEMFSQFTHKEMLLKCQLGDKKCTIVFYQTSKIKAIIYLTLDLQMTNQKEIIQEITVEMNEMQQTNKKLQRQCSRSKKHIQEKDLEIQELKNEKTVTISAFIENIQKVQAFFQHKQITIETILNVAVDNLKIKLDRVQSKIDILKKKTKEKITANNQLAEDMAKLKLDNVDQVIRAQELKKQNCQLNMARCNLEKQVTELKTSLQDTQIINHNLERRQEELEKDLEKISVAVTQKDKQIDEMSKDLIQANTMLVNFNNHYDKKAREVEELRNDCSVKEMQIIDQQAQYNDLLNTFQNYEQNYNKSSFERLKQDVFTANKRNSDLEEQLRKLQKMNVLLSQKVEQGGFYNLH